MPRRPQLLAADRLARGAREDRDITDQLDGDDRRLRDDLLRFVRDQHPGVTADARLTLVQKLPERIILIAFAKDRLPAFAGGGISSYCFSTAVPVSRTRITRFRISVMSSIAKRTPSRPRPESLTPP